jgi:hypothetical protein
VEAIKIILKMTAAVSKAATAVILAEVILAAVDFQVADILAVAMAVTLAVDSQVAAVFPAVEGLVLAPVVADSTITVRRRIVLRVFYSKSIPIGTARLMPRK